MAAIVSTRILRLQAIAPRTAATDLQTGINIGNATLVAGTAASTVVANAAAGAAESGALAGLANKLNKSASDTLSGTISIAASSSAGMKWGSITWDASGAVTGGTGVAITPGGIVTAQSGAATASWPASGAPTFGGQLTAASGTFYGDVGASGNVNVSGYVKATGGTSGGTATASIVGAPANSAHVAGDFWSVSAIGLIAHSVYRDAINASSASTSGGYCGVFGSTADSTGAGGFFYNSGGGPAVYASSTAGTSIYATQNAIVGGSVTNRGVIADTNATRDISDSSHYYNYGYIAQPVSAIHWYYDNGTVNQTSATWSTINVCTGHSATASDYYGGAVPTNAAIVFPCLKINLHGKVVMLIDAHGVGYNSTNW